MAHKIEEGGAAVGPWRCLAPAVEVVTKSQVTEVAEVAEALASAALAERGAPQVHFRGKGHERTLHVVDDKGRPTGKLATHGQVVVGAAKVAELTLAVASGKRPDRIVCCDCAPDSPTRFVYVPPVGGIPKRCIICASDKEQRRIAAKRASLPCATPNCAGLVCKDGGICRACRARKMVANLSPDVLSARAKKSHISGNRAYKPKSAETRAKMAAGVKRAREREGKEILSERARKGHATRRKAPLPQPGSG